jgi:hypothetical protein
MGLSFYYRGLWGTIQIKTIAVYLTRTDEGGKNNYHKFSQFKTGVVKDGGYH